MKTIVYTVNSQNQENNDEGTYYGEGYAPAFIGFKTREEAETYLHNETISELRQGLLQHPHLHYDSYTAEYNVDQIEALKRIVGEGNIAYEGGYSPQIKVLSDLQIPEELSDKDCLRVIDILSFQPYSIHTLEIQE